MLMVFKMGGWMRSLELVDWVLDWNIGNVNFSIFMSSYDGGLMQLQAING